ncbi:MAG: TonB-dependent receptor plug domain-containing protein [Gammaproteobacteria bacterium]
MNRNASKKAAALAAGIVSILAAAAAHAQDESDELGEVVVTGTRVANRSALETVGAVDVVSGESLQNAGVTELNQALSVALPSFNFPRPGLADGTDTIRPATLRGLAPDQTLVLLNSKRRHAASLVNVNGTIGRGAAAVDLNTVPTAIVRSIEVLRDGASAQYGSDAIAGVINVRLLEEREGGNLTGSFGTRDSGYSTPTGTPPVGATWSAPAVLSRDASDGDVLTVSGWKGLPLGGNGFITLALEYKDQERTERDGWDFRQQYPLVAGVFDPREAGFDRYNAWYGEPELEQLTFFANAGADLANGARVYGWASYQDRQARSAGFFRRALDDRNVIQIYPDGFLPIIAPDVTDWSAAFGVAWSWAEWEMDSSLVYGFNEMEFTIENTLNRSLGPASPTVFDSGGFDYDQLVFNFSGVRQVSVGAFASPLNIAAGIEARQESYSIFAGEPDSYRNGGVLLPNGQPTASGAQVFPGFRPANEVSEDRTAVGAYLDLEANLTEKLLGSTALRLEDYSDFGSNVSGKIALRYDFTDTFALRGSVQNGFRAPSLPQQFFATTSTNFINGVPFDITTFPVSDPVAIALGAQPLDAEESLNYSLGAVLRIGEVTVTIDAYRIDIDDRIVLSENLTQANVRQFLTDQGFIGIGGGRFFINGVDTETEGLDLVVSWPWESAGAGTFDFTLVANYNSTDVTRVPATAPLSALSPPPPLFDRINILTFEEGNPEDKYAAIVNWRLNRFGATFRATRYGKALDPGTSAALDFELGDQTLLDLEARFDVTDSIRLAVGAENLTDEYPDAFPTARNATGNTPFSNYSPFGRSGRYVYGRLAVDF